MLIFQTPFFSVLRVATNACCPRRSGALDVAMSRGDDPPLAPFEELVHTNADLRPAYPGCGLRARPHPCAHTGAGAVTPRPHGTEQLGRTRLQHAIASTRHRPVCDQLPATDFFRPKCSFVSDGQLELSAPKAGTINELTPTGCKYVYA